jgi:hypothetical protein
MDDNEVPEVRLTALLKVGFCALLDGDEDFLDAVVDRYFFVSAAGERDFWSDALAWLKAEHVEYYRLKAHIQSLEIAKFAAEAVS